jgi:uncharacterized RDD family membrane protein YckC
MTTTVRLAGFATRVIALAIDGAILNAVAILALAGLWLAGSVVGLDLEIRGIAAGATAAAAWLVLVGVYLVAFWTLVGQTPGMRCMGIRVLSRDGGQLGRGEALVRLGGMLLAAVPAGAGFLLILVDDRRRGLHDWLAGTLVVHVPARTPVGEEAPGYALAPEDVPRDARAHTPAAGTTAGVQGDAQASLLGARRPATLRSDRHERR